MKRLLALPVLLVLFGVLFRGVSLGEPPEVLEPKPLELGTGSRMVPGSSILT